MQKSTLSNALLWRRRRDSPLRLRLACAPRCAHSRRRFPGAGKPSTGRFSGSALRIPLNHNTNKSTRADALVCGGEGGIRTLAPVTPVYSLSRGAPYSHLGTSPYSISPFLAEREGFEPPVPFSITGFQDQLHKPLGHLSKICT